MFGASILWGGRQTLARSSTLLIALTREAVTVSELPLREGTVAVPALAQSIHPTPNLTGVICESR
jgi:hypothetical protein